LSARVAEPDEAAPLMDWIDQFPWWAVTLVSFGAGALLGLVLRTARKGKYESKEA